MVIKKTVNIFLGIIIILFYLPSIVSASAVYSESLDQINIDNEPDGINFTRLYTLINNDEILSHDGSIWYLNATIRLLSGTQMYINNTDVTKLIINDSNKLYYWGNFHIQDIEIEGGSELGIGGSLHNVSFNNTGQLRLNGIEGDIYDITITNGKGSGLVFYDAHDFALYNISITNITNHGINFLTGCTDVDMYNIYIKNAFRIN